MDTQIQTAKELQEAGRLQEAVDIYSRLLQQNPRHLDALHLLAGVAFQCNDFKVAEKLIERALKIDPDNAAFHHDLAGVLRVLGEFDAARTHYHAAISLDPDNAETFFNLAAIVRFSTEDTSILEDIERLLANTNLSKKERSFLHFAAGKYFDDTKQYEQAFIHFDSGNKTRGTTFDCDKYIKHIDKIVSTFSFDFVQANRAKGFSDLAPVFVVGMPRSGTTLVEQILSAHRDISAAGELPDISGITTALPQHSENKLTYPECMPSLRDDAFSGFGQAYINRLRKVSTTSTRIIDKNPENHQHIGLILSLLPDARFIHCSRNPLDTCLSCYSQNFHGGQEFSFSLEGISTYYRQYRRLMDYWRLIAPDRIIDMPYEELIEDVEDRARALIDFLELGWDEHCLNYHEVKRAINTASDVQVRQPVYKSSVNRSDNYARQLAPLAAMLADLLPL